MKTAPVTETVKQLFARFAAGYEAYLLRTQSTHNIAVCVEFRLLDLMNEYRGYFASSGLEVAEATLLDSVQYDEGKWAKA